MKNKGFIHALSIILSLLCGYYLFFTFLDNKIQEEATEKYTIDGKIDYAQKQDYLNSLWDKEVFKIFKHSITYKDVKNKALNFGLDLQGGMHFILEISLDDLIISLIKPIHKEKISNVLSNIPQSSKNDINLFLKNFIDNYALSNSSVSLAECFIVNKDISIHSSNKDIIDYIKIEFNKAVDKAYRIIQLRIDKYGTSQPSIQKLASTNKIQVEIPGVNNPERIRPLLQDVAQLEFWQVCEDNDKLIDVVNNLNRVNEDESQKEINSSNNEKIDFQDQNNSEDEKSDNEIFKLNNDFLYKEEDIDKVNKIINSKIALNIIPKNIKFLWAKHAITNKNNDKYYKLYAVQLDRYGNSLLKGDVISHANQSRDEYHRVTVSMKMNEIGTKLWSNITANNIGKAIAITLDDKVYTAPVVNTVIPNGESQISGNYTLEEAQDLANILQTGSLPVKIKITEETVIGPTMSKISQRQAITSILLGILVTILFMIFYYNRAGIIADIALCFNLFFILGILAQFGAVLTLPSIAGIVLTIGMAIDINILIYERIKEELRLGTSIRDAIMIGYNKASSSIFDANITTLLIGIILYYFGQGSVKGFATTLIIGIVCSLFTAFFMTQTIYKSRDKKHTLSKLKFDYDYNKNWLSNIKYDFIKIRKSSYLFSLLIICSGLFCLYQEGFKVSVEFTGGREYIMKINSQSDFSNTNDISDKISKALGSEYNCEVKMHGANDIMSITTNYKLDSQESDKDINQQFTDIFAKSINMSQSEENEPNSFNVIGVNKVESTVANDIRQSAKSMIIFSLLMIFIYIAIRFKKIKYGFAALLALIHDVLVLFAFYGILLKFGVIIEINQVIVTALLTVIGYSINNTVVIYDRIRSVIENSENNISIKDILNTSINGTLSRTLLTSTSTILVVLIILLFGGISLRGFSIVLFIGFLFGTYSSIFISAPILIDLKNESK